MSKTRVFLGPTLQVSEARQIACFDYHPPAKRGDIYLAVIRDGVDAIGLIDGYYDTFPAVLHREIMFALSNGIAVYGGASIGAIRAAELTRFGMVGVGAIYRDYLSGRLTGDDEVAILHAPAELNFAILVDAMVNIRATLEAAVEAGILDIHAADGIIQLAKSRCFRERNFNRLVAEAATLRPGDINPATLCEWAAENWVDQKAKDAKQLLEHLRDNLQRPASTPFIATTQWLMAIEDLEIYAQS